MGCTVLSGLIHTLSVTLIGPTTVITIQEIIVHTIAIVDYIAGVTEP